MAMLVRRSCKAARVIKWSGCYMRSQCFPSKWERGFNGLKRSNARGLGDMHRQAPTRTLLFRVRCSRQPRRMSNRDWAKATLSHWSKNPSPSDANRNACVDWWACCPSCLGNAIDFSLELEHDSGVELDCQRVSFMKQINNIQQPSHRIQ